MKAKEETNPPGKSQAYAARMSILSKGKFGRSHHPKKQQDVANVRCFECNELGHCRRNCLKLTKESNQRKGTKRKDGAHTAEEVKELKKKKTKEEDPRDVFFR